MKRLIACLLFVLLLGTSLQSVHALSVTVATPDIFFPKGYDAQRAQQIKTALSAKQFKYVDGLTSYWEPDFTTTLVYDGTNSDLNAFLAGLQKLEGITIRLTISPDLSKESGTGHSAGTWWVMYRHTEPNTLTVRINLSAESLKGKNLAIILPK